METKPPDREDAHPDCPNCLGGGWWWDMVVKDWMICPCEPKWREEKK